MAPWQAKNGTLVDTNGENGEFSCVLNYSHMKSISVYDNYIPYTFKITLIYIRSFQYAQKSMGTAAIAF